ncbi:MAG TPA: hypothetical protein VFB38_06710 [Chthonomonadaceae bacterium]|nr:hypothetical protein [Chthonomonadaceae bacterium]
MSHPRFSNEEIQKRAEELYDQNIRAKVETDENIGKILVIDIETGEYEMDADEIAASRRAMAKHPGHALYMMRIGYDAVHTFGGRLEPTKR